MSSRPLDPTSAEAAAQDHRAAAELATAAGELLLKVRSNGATGTALKDAGDGAAQELLAELLAQRFPDDAVLSEEAVDDKGRLGAERVWIIDPLDGTREFAELDRVDWAVHVALVVGGELTVGAVALPAQHLTFSTGAPLPELQRHDGAPRVVVSRTRPASFTQRLVDQLGADLVPMGSAGAKAMAVVQGDAEVYAHSGGQYEWDSAAPVAVAAAAGLHVSRLDGSPLRYNQDDVWLPDLLICVPDLAASVIDLCSE